MNSENPEIKKETTNLMPKLTIPPLKEKRSNILILIFLTIAAFCILGIIIINTVSSLAPGNYLFSDSSISTFHMENGSTLIVFRERDKTDSVVIDNTICYVSCTHGYVEEFVNDAFTAFDVYSKTVMCLDAERSELSVITAKDGEICIASNAKSAQMDECGNNIFYIDSESQLNLYEIKSRKTKVIDTNVLSCDAVSMSGNAFIYSKEDGIYVSVNGKIGETCNIANCNSIFSVTDDGKIIYYLEKNSSLYNVSVYIDGKSDVLIPDFHLDKPFSAFFNKDRTEIILSYNGETYISCNSIELKKVCDGNLVYPMKPETASREQGIPFVNTYANTMITISNENGEYELVHVNENLTGEHINGITSAVRITEDGKYVYGVNEDTLVRIDISNGYKNETVATSVVAYTVSFDGKDVYYTDADGTLWHVYNEKSKKIASDCNEFFIDRDGTLFFISTADNSKSLYYSRFGSSPKKIDSSENVFSLFSLDGYTYFTSYSDNGIMNLFAVSKNGCHKIFDKIIY